MATDAQLRDQAWAELVQTTDSYPTWKKKGFPASSHWTKAKALLDQIGAVTPPPPPPPTVLTIALTADKVGAVASAVSAGAKQLKWARTSTAISADAEYNVQTLVSQFLGTPAKPWVAAVAVDAAGNDIGQWTARLLTTQVAPPPPSGFAIGIDANLGQGGRKDLVQQVGFKKIRESNGDCAIPWAHSVGIKVLGIAMMNQGSPAMGADEVETDNEPWNRDWAAAGGWNGNPAAYCAATRDLLRTLKAQHPNVITHIPVGPPWNNGDVQQPDGSWLDCVLMWDRYTPDIWPLVDRVAPHPYSQPNPPNWAVLDKYRASLNSIGQGHIPFSVTEVGWPVSGGNGVSEQQQADYISMFITQAKARGDVSDVYPYQSQDWGARDGDPEHWFGIFDSAGRARPAVAVLQQAIKANP